MTAKTAPINIPRAIAILRAADPYHFRIWHLAGDRNSTVRQELMLALTGAKLPKAKCGVTALEAAFHAIAEPAGDYPRQREDSFATWARDYPAMGA